MAKALELTLDPSGSMSVNAGSTASLIANFEPEAQNYVNISASVTSGSAYVSVSGGSSETGDDSCTFTVTGRAAGTATIRVYAYRTSGTLVDDTAYITVTVNKVKATITHAPELYPSLTYNGSDQRLLRLPALADAGTVVYRIGSSGSWNSDYTEIKKKSAGSYDIQYYVDATGTDYADSDVYTISTSIAVDIVERPDTTLQIYNWDGQTKTPTVTPASNQMSVTGITSAVSPGTYTVTYSLIDPGDRVWDTSPPETGNKTKTWTINPPNVLLSQTSFTVLNNTPTTFNITLTPSIGMIGDINSIEISDKSPATANIVYSRIDSGVAIYFRSTSPATYTFTLTLRSIEVVSNNNIAYVSKTATITVESQQSEWLKSTVYIDDGEQMRTATPYVCLGGNEWAPADIYIKS